VDAGRTPATSTPQRAATPKKTDVSEWFYTPVWKESPLERTAQWGQPKCWIVFTDASELGSAVVRQLTAHKQDVIVVQSGNQFAQIADGHYAMNPRQRSDYGLLFENLRTAGKAPDRIMHTWNVVAAEADAMDLGFYSLLYLTQALAEHEPTKPVQIAVVTQHTCDLSGAEPLSPAKAGGLGACLVIPQEYPAVSTIAIDIDIGSSEANQHKLTTLADRLIS
jgi:hypothetical protein